MTIFRNQQSGFTLFISVVTASLVLAIGLSILTITLKQFLLSSTIRDSEYAFYAADAGMECALYWDTSSQGGKFDPAPAATNNTVECMGDGPYTTGGQTLDLVGNVTDEMEIEWGSNPTLCARVSVTKIRGGTCPLGVTCTQIQSRGYNRPCAELTNPRTVERALRTRYGN